MARTVREVRHTLLCSGNGNKSSRAKGGNASSRVTGSSLARKTPARQRGRRRAGGREEEAAPEAAGGASDVVLRTLRRGPCSCAGAQGARPPKSPATVTGSAGPGTSEHPTASLYLLFIVVVCWDICLVKRQSHCTQTSQGRVLRRVWAVARPAAGAGGAGAAGRLPRSTPSFR